MNWNDTFLTLFDRCVTEFQSGNHDYATYYNPQDQELLARIGCKPREFFDFVEDFCVDGTPSPSTALLVAAARRDEVQRMKTVADAFLAAKPRTGFEAGRGSRTYLLANSWLIYLFGRSPAPSIRVSLQA